MARLFPSFLHYDSWPIVFHFLALTKISLQRFTHSIGDDFWLSLAHGKED